MYRTVWELSHVGSMFWVWTGSTMLSGWLAVWLEARMGNRASFFTGTYRYQYYPEKDTKQDDQVEAVFF